MLGKLSAYLLHIVAGVAVAFALLAGVQTMRLSGERAAHAETKAEHNLMVAAAEKLRADAVAVVREEEARRYDELRGIANETAQALIRARADGDAAVGVALRLRDRIAALMSAASRCAADSAATDGGEAARATDDLLADVQRRLDEASSVLARHADDARIAGLGCERSYEALTPR